MSAVWTRFRRNRLAVFGLVIVVVMVIAAVFADLIAPYGPTETVRGAQRQGPSWDHLFGTDRLGRDSFSRFVYGARISLKVGTLATLIAVVIGTIVGAIAGFFGGIVDTFLMRFVDIFLSIPYVILAVAIATVFGRSVNSLIIVIGLTGWLAIARVVRATFLSLRNLEYMEAAEALGFSRGRRILRHLLPNASVPIMVYGTIAIGSAILSEAALSFIQVGPPEGSPAWGRTISDNNGDLATLPLTVFVPGLGIFLTVLAFVLVGDGLRDALDPKLRR